MSIGLQRTGYRKAVVTASGPLPVSSDEPWLFNIAATADVTSRLSFYGSFTRGLEESDVAPEIALNRDEAPPAIGTRQLDAGARLRIGPMTVIAGGFDIEKPYYGLDTANFFRDLGTVKHRGVEFSVNGAVARGLTLVAGGVFLDARVTGDEVQSGAIGRRPVGTPEHVMSGNIDWRPGGSSAWSVDVALQRHGPSFADAVNRVRVQGYDTVDLGMRYRFAIGGKNTVLRLRVTNLFNSYGWDVSGNNAFTYNQSRQFVSRLTTDI